MSEALALPAEGHRPTLVAAFLHFAVTTMVWVLLGALGIYIAEDLGLNAVEKGLVVAIPMLSGSLLRIPLGLLSDRIGAKRVGLAMLAFLLLPLFAAWAWADSLPALLAVGLLLGLAGASFAVVIPLASRWYPPARQGLILGITGAGTCSTVLSYLFAPPLADRFGWRLVLAGAIVPIAAVAMVFALLARDRPPPKRATARDYVAVLRHPDLWMLGVVYAVTFGGYVGLGSFLPVLLRDEHGVSPGLAGAVAAAAALAGGAIRPLGGYLADRWGGSRLLHLLLPAIGLAYLAAGRGPALPGLVALVAIAMLCMGAGNGAVFQVVPTRFPDRIGIATGFVGAFGGLGAFALPILLGAIRQQTGSFGPGFAALAAAAGGAALWQRARTGQAPERDGASTPSPVPRPMGRMVRGTRRKPGLSALSGVPGYDG